MHAFRITMYIISIYTMILFVYMIIHIVPHYIVSILFHTIPDSIRRSWFIVARDEDEGFSLNKNLQYPLFVTNLIAYLFHIQDVLVCAFNEEMKQKYFVNHPHQHRHIKKILASFILQTDIRYHAKPKYNFPKKPLQYL